MICKVGSGSSPPYPQLFVLPARLLKTCANEVAPPKHCCSHSAASMPVETFMCFKTICLNANHSVGALCLSLAVDNGSSVSCWVFLHRRGKYGVFWGVACRPRYECCLHRGFPAPTAAWGQEGLAPGSQQQSGCSLTSFSCSSFLFPYEILVSCPNLI